MQQLGQRALVANYIKRYIFNQINKVLFTKENLFICDELNYSLFTMCESTNLKR